LPSSERLDPAASCSPTATSGTHFRFRSKRRRVGSLMLWLELAWAGERCGPGTGQFQAKDSAAWSSSAKPSPIDRNPGSSGLSTQRRVHVLHPYPSSPATKHSSKRGNAQFKASRARTYPQPLHRLRAGPLRRISPIQKPWWLAKLPIILRRRLN